MPAASRSRRFTSRLRRGPRAIPATASAQRAASARRSAAGEPCKTGGENGNGGRRTSQPAATSAVLARYESGKPSARISSRPLSQIDRVVTAKSLTFPKRVLTMMSCATQSSGWA